MVPVLKPFLVVSSDSVLSSSSSRIIGFPGSSPSAAEVVDGETVSPLVVAKVLGSLPVLELLVEPEELVDEAVVLSVAVSIVAEVGTVVVEEVDASTPFGDVSRSEGQSLCRLDESKHQSASAETVCKDSKTEEMAKIFMLLMPNFIPGLGDAPTECTSASSFYKTTTDFGNQNSPGAPVNRFLISISPRKKEQLDVTEVSDVTPILIPGTKIESFSRIWPGFLRLPLMFSSLFASNLTHFTLSSILSLSDQVANNSFFFGYLSQMWEEELIKSRHFQDYPDYHAEVSFPVSGFSQFMTSQCHPEANGYFGSTSGQPLVVQYGFEMEFTDLIDAERALGVINDHVMDQVLSDTFPSICAATRRQLSSSSTVTSSKVTGFAFQEIILDELCKFMSLCALPESTNAQSISHSRIYTLDVCEPLYGATNTCKVYSSRMSVFGHGLDENGVSESILDRVHDALESAPLTTSGALRVTVVDDLTTEISVPHYGQGSNGLSILTLLGLIAAILAFMLAICGVFFFTNVDDNAGEEEAEDEYIIGKNIGGRETNRMKTLCKTDEVSWWKRWLIKGERSTDETIMSPSTGMFPEPGEEYMDLFRQSLENDDTGRSLDDDNSFQRVSVTSQLSYES